MHACLWWSVFLMEAEVNVHIADIHIPCLTYYMIFVCYIHIFCSILMSNWHPYRVQKLKVLLDVQRTSHVSKLKFLLQPNLTQQKYRFELQARLTLYQEIYFWSSNLGIFGWMTKHEFSRSRRQGKVLCHNKKCFSIIWISETFML